MKILLSVISLMIFFTSCDSFLEYKDKDKVIPSELEHYDELVYGEILTKSGGAICKNLAHMTDEVGSWVPDNLWDSDKDERLSYYPYYTWAKEPQITEKGDENIDPAWEHFYNRILMCNIVENDLSEFEEDLDGVKLRLLGEVQCIRAISYFYLVNMYGAPYENAEQAKTAMGVPVNKEISIDNKLYRRESLQAVYDLMEKDLLSALDNFKKGQVKNTIFRPNKDVASLFLSRIYLYMKRYDDVITICDNCLKETNKGIISLEEMKGYDEYNQPLLNKNSNSVFFTWMERNSFFSEYSSARFFASEELRGSYDPNDVRLNAFFNYYYKHPIKNTSYSKCYGFFYRIEEIYFNRAEAYIESGDYVSGMSDLNDVYTQRNTEGQALDANDVTEARRLFREEKSKEFCFEDIRWFDIRRWNVRVVHNFQEFNDKSVVTSFVLEEGSPNYILPLPLDIQRQNDVIEQPKREDSKVLTK